MENKNEQKPNFYSLYQMVGEIKGEVRGISKRLDRINGRLSNHENRINKAEEDCTIVKTKSGIIGGMAGFLVSLIALIVAYFKSR